MPSLSILLKHIGLGFEHYRIFEYAPSNRQPTYRVVPVNAERVSQVERLRGLKGYDGPEAHGFGVEVDGELVSVCWYWHGDRYKQKRGFIELPKGGAKLVQIMTIPTYRGRGVATALILGSSAQMIAHGFTPLLARVWHSNAPSCSAFRKAGWRESMTITTFTVPLLAPIKITRKHSVVLARVAVGRRRSALAPPIPGRVTLVSVSDRSRRFCPAAHGR